MPKTNNFDLIRLAAALQVALMHALAGLGVATAAWPLRAIADWFPGVPIFFFISGFLISKSFEKNSVVREYALNRFPQKRLPELHVALRPCPDGLLKVVCQGHH